MRKKLSIFVSSCWLTRGQVGGLSGFLAQLDILRWSGWFRPQAPCNPSLHFLSPIQILTELNVAWLQWSYENRYFQVDKPLRSIRTYLVHIIIYSLTGGFLLLNHFAVRSSVYQMHFERKWKKDVRRERNTIHCNSCMCVCLSPCVWILN